MRWLLRHAIAITAAACLFAYVFVYATGRVGPPIRSDAFSYYVYLPSWFLYDDVTLQRVANDCCGGRFPEFTAITRWPGTGRWVNAHPVGVAVLMAPLFFVAHLLTRWTNLSPDGFTLYYQHAAGLSGLVCAVLGLWFLRRLLARHFTDGVHLAALGAILLGTSLFHYATYDSAWSHAFTFFLGAVLLERLDAGQGGRLALATIGVISGLIVLTRHTNIVIPLLLVTARVRRPSALALAGGLAALVVVPQLLLYHRATGHFLVSSYGTLGFTFGSPHVWGVLFSVQKGVFFWAPVLLLAIPGYLALPATLRWMRTPALIVLVIHCYLVSSWWDWQFGASFGHRGFVDIYPLLAPALAAALTWVARTRPPVRIALSTGVALACALTFFEMLQYWNGVLPHSDTTWAQYREVFLRLR
jgi:hypothetical protein